MEKTKINAALRAIITTQAAHVAGVVVEINTTAKGEAVHYALALTAIETLWQACKGDVGAYDAAISELAADVHETCVSAGIEIGKRAKGDDGANDDDGERRARGRVNTFMSNFRVIARKVGETKGAFDLDRPFWRCYDDAKAKGAGSNRGKGEAVKPTALTAHPAKELAKALGELAAKDDAALIEAFHMLTDSLRARKASIDVTAITAIGKRYAA